MSAKEEKKYDIWYKTRIHYRRVMTWVAMRSFGERSAYFDRTLHYQTLEVQA